MELAEIRRLENAIETYVKGARVLSQAVKTTSLFRGVLGEALVVQQLIRTYRKELAREDGHIRFLGSSRKKRDIAFCIRGHEVGIECKTKSGKEWVRLNAKKSVNVSPPDANDIQHIGEILEPHDDLLWVFADLQAVPTGGDPEFYVFTDREAKSIVREVYSHGQDWRVRKRTKGSYDLKIPVETLLELGPSDCHDNKLTRVSRLVP